VAVAVALPLNGLAQSPFRATADVTRGADGDDRVVVTLAVPTNHYLYADRVEIASANTNIALVPELAPEPVRHHDEIMGEEVAVYEQDVSFTFRVPGGTTPVAVTVAYQGCSKEPMLCFLPQRETIPLARSGSAVPSASSVAAPVGHWEKDAASFTEAGRAVGYMRTGEFLEFLALTDAGTTPRGDSLDAALREHGVWLVLLLILVGGLALNLTPCVLPMIPVNIAIIGAGAQAGSRLRGLGLGAAYGAGISLVYGALGLLVVLTGAKFGALNASPWFNLAIAVLFLVMALAMFDAIHVDFSRFQKGGAPLRKGGFVAALALGAVAALLAGACVAPVVISVLLLATDLHARGIYAGLLLPFVLGMGMALPWPFAGAGLSFLPKPGRWMERVKRVFGVIIVILALWYGRLGVSLLMARAGGGVPGTGAQSEGWITSLDEGFAAGLREGKPVLIDFWATWCKNCVQMDKTTFKDPQVIERLKDFVAVKYQAENVADSQVGHVLDHFGAVGLPTYVILMPKAGDASAAQPQAPGK
jgi:thiol:disulfide interchange protein DsbD